MLDKAREFVEKYDVVKLGFSKGTISRINLKYSNDGRAFVYGALDCTKTWSYEGKERKDYYTVNFNASGELAEQMAELAEGDRMLILTERQRRKSGDRWYENDRVILFQKIE